MADIRNNFVGIKSPNPFWLASAPPTDKAYNVIRAFKAGWGGVVWKTLGEEGPPVVNVNGPRYGAIWGADRRLLGLNNIELITDRDLQVNLREIKQVKKDWPDRAIVVSLMVPCVEESWKAILPVVEETEADGIELNFGCPHGMSERGMGAAVGQVPEYIEMVVRWCKANTRMPVITKLTPNITDVRKPARAALAGGTDAVSLINTINSITGVDLDSFAPQPTIDGKGIAWRLLRPGGEADRAEHGGRDRPRSGNLRPADFRHRRHHHLARCGRVPGARRRQCAGLHGRDDLRLQDRAGDDHRAFKLDGRQGPPAASTTSCGRAVPNVTDWQYLNLNYIAKAHIDQDACIKCGRCHIACEDTSHQAITSMVDGVRHFEVIEAECVGCNLCVNVCPVENCITMEPLAVGVMDQRTGKPVSPIYANWTTHPNNPMAKVAAE